MDENANKNFKYSHIFNKAFPFFFLHSVFPVLLTHRTALTLLSFHYEAITSQHLFVPPTFRSHLENQLGADTL